MNQEKIDRYLAGRLSEAEAEAFEEYCVAHPEFARQVEFEQRLKVGILQVARGDTADFVRAQSPRWPLTLAAGVVLVLFAGLLLWNRFLPRHDPVVMMAVTAESSPQAKLLRLALVRGGEGTPELPEGWVRVAIAGLFDPGHAYSIALDRLDVGRNVDTIASLSGQHPSSPVTLEVLVDSDQLERGTYSLRVRKQVPGEEALDFEFLKR